jgi:hypothetical protein
MNRATAAAAALTVVLASACGPSASGETDDDGATTDATGVSADATAGSESGTTLECPPNMVYASPGCDDPQPGSGLVPLPAAGCYPVCDGGDSSACNVGACVRTSIDPCFEQACDACASETWLCIAGDPLAPGFEADLGQPDGCGMTSFQVFAGTPEGDLALGVTFTGTLVETAQMTGMTQQQSYTLPSEDVVVWVSMGPGVLGNQCNDAPFGTELRFYASTSGVADVEFQPAAMGSDFGDQGIATITLTDVELQGSGPSGEVVALPSYTFTSVPIWCCPG